MRWQANSLMRAWRGAAALGLVAAASACALVVEPPDVTIGTGSLSGVYYPLGDSICRLFNLERVQDGRRCVAQPSAGPVANIEALKSGRIDIGIVQSDVLADAAAGAGPFAAYGRDASLRVLFTGHAEAFTLVARRALGIRSAAELRGTRINMGSPGSGERIAMARVMAALGVTQQDFASVQELSRGEQHRALCNGELDAMVYSVGHPDGLIRDALSMCGSVLLDVSGAPIDAMLARHPEYAPTVIRGNTYADNPLDVQTLGVRAVVVATTRLPDRLAYEITKAVFDNFEDFRRLHPLFAMLSTADMAAGAGSAPIHPGAQRYYRERGWGPEKR